MRRYSRLTFRHVHRVQVTNRLSGDAMGYVADLSLGGLRLISAEPLVVGGCYELCLHVPAHNERVREVEVVVICQWSRKQPRRNGFEIGFALDRPAPAFAALVAEQMPRRRSLS